MPGVDLMALVKIYKAQTRVTYEDAHYENRLTLRQWMDEHIGVVGVPGKGTWAPDYDTELHVTVLTYHEEHHVLIMCTWG